jgi:hypothetical protein
MLKLLFYVFLIYVGYKFYRLLKASSAIYRSYHYHDNRSFEEKKEGEIHIKDNTSHKNEKTSAKKDKGDYIDFEEIRS